LAFLAETKCSDFAAAFAVLVHVNLSRFIAVKNRFGTDHVSINGRSGLSARWLRLKKWLTHQDHEVRVMSDASWTRCWVCLRGGVLELYRDENQTQQLFPIGQSIHAVETVAFIVQQMPAMANKSRVPGCSRFC